MVYWIRKCAALLGSTVFFILFFLCLAVGQAFSLHAVSTALVRALVGASLAWVAGIVIADIFLKGVLGDLDGGREALLEGGLVQRLQTMKSSSSPGGSDMPLGATTVAEKKHKSGNRS
jgi:hypothetical protein